MIPLGTASAPRGPRGAAPPGSATPPALAPPLGRDDGASLPPAVTLDGMDPRLDREGREGGRGALDGKAGRGEGLWAVGGVGGGGGGGDGGGEGGREPSKGGPRSVCARRSASNGCAEEAVGRACVSREERRRRSRAGGSAERASAAVAACGGVGRGEGGVRGSVGPGGCPKEGSARQGAASLLRGRVPAGGTEAGRGAAGGVLPEAACCAPASLADETPTGAPVPLLGAPRFASRGEAGQALFSSVLPSTTSAPLPSAPPSALSSAASAPPSPPSPSRPSSSSAAPSSSSPPCSSPLSLASLCDPALQPALVQGLCTAGCRPSVAERAADLVLARERAEAAKRSDRLEGAQPRSGDPSAPRTAPTPPLVSVAPAPLPSVASTPPPLYPSLERLLPPAARLAASLEGRARRGGPAAVAARRRELASGARLALDLASRRRAVAVLLAGTSGTGKSTLASLLAARLGFSAALSTDSVRAALRSFADPRDDPVLFASTYDAGGALERGGAGQGELGELEGLEESEKQGELGEQGEGEGKHGGRGGGMAGGVDMAPTTGVKADEGAEGTATARAPRGVGADGIQPVSLPGSPARSPPPPLSLHPRTLEGYRLQRSRVLPRVEQLVLSALRRGQSIVVEGVHLSPSRAAALAHEAHAQWARQVAAEAARDLDAAAKYPQGASGGDRGAPDGAGAPGRDRGAPDGAGSSLPDGASVRAPAATPTTAGSGCAPSPRPAQAPSLLPPLILPVVLHIRSAARHAERFSVRAKSGSLRARDNRYVRHLEAIRAIQASLLAEAAQAACPALHNANVDRTLAVVHGALLRLASGDERAGREDGLLAAAGVEADDMGRLLPPFPAPERRRGDPEGHPAPLPLRLPASLERAMAEAAAAAWSKRGALAAIRERNASGGRRRKGAWGRLGTQGTLEGQGKQGGQRNQKPHETLQAGSDAGAGPSAHRERGEADVSDFAVSPAPLAVRERSDSVEERASSGAPPDAAPHGDPSRPPDLASNDRAARASSAPSAPLPSPRAHAAPASAVEPQPRDRPGPVAPPLESRPRSPPAALSPASSPPSRATETRAPDTPQPSEQGRNATSCRACGAGRTPPAPRRSNPEGGSPLATAAALAAAARGILSAVAAAAARRSPLAKARTGAEARERGAREICDAAGDVVGAGRGVVAGAGPIAGLAAEREPEDGASSPRRSPLCGDAPASPHDASLDPGRAPGLSNLPSLAPPPKSSLLVPLPPPESSLLAPPLPRALSTLASRLLAGSRPEPASRPLATPCAPPCTRASSPPPAAPRSPSAALRAPRPSSTSPTLGGTGESVDEETRTQERASGDGWPEVGGGCETEQVGGSNETTAAAARLSNVASTVCDVPAMHSPSHQDLLHPAQPTTLHRDPLHTPPPASYPLHASPSRAHRSAPSLPSASSPTDALPCPARRPLASPWCQRPQSPWSDPGHDASCSSAEEGSHGCSWSASGAASAEHSWLEGPWLAEASEQGAHGARSDADDDALPEAERGAPTAGAQPLVRSPPPSHACSCRPGDEEGDAEGGASPRCASEGGGRAGTPAAPSGGDAEGVEACSRSSDWLPLGAFGHVRRRCAGSAAPAPGDAASSPLLPPAWFPPALPAPALTGDSRRFAEAAPLARPSPACPAATHGRSSSECLGPPSPPAGDDHPLRLGGSPGN